VSGDGETITIDADATPSSVETGRGFWARFERLLVALGDRLNPILVKETRQALKSRQFVLTLLLSFAWGWSLLGVAMIGQEIFYGSHGPTMFVGYYLILAFPLLVVVPYSAFRSLAAEQEERTYEMLSITALGPRQIVWGKFGSAVTQVIVYLSAVTPCLAFTYMLQGVAILSIAWIVFYVSVASMGLSMICLFLGTLTTEKYLQVIVSVLAIIGLLLAFYMGCWIPFAMLTFGGEQVFREKEFWITNAALVTFVVGYFLLVFEAAAAQITFAADNRSTRLRMVMLGQFALWTAWMAFAWIESKAEPGVLSVFAVFAVLHWAVMGTMMSGESPDLSLRVRRRLPRSTLGRVFLTWFNPGPCTGFMFAVAGLLGVLLMVMVGYVAQPIVAASSNRYTSNPERSVWFAFFALCYGTFFLGLGLLLIRAIRKVSPVGILTALLFQCLLVLAFSGIPAIIQMMSSYRNQDYSALQVINPVWTSAYLLDKGLPAAESALLMTLVPAAALLMFVLNLPGVVRELRYVRLAAPERVAEEDAEMAAAKAPPGPTRTSPWDE